MTVARIIEISSISSRTFEDAIIQGVARANKTLKNVNGAWVKDQEVTTRVGRLRKPGDHRSSVACGGYLASRKRYD